MGEASGVLSGKTALVTGAARGLGVYIAEALINAGANVALVARSADLLRQQAARLGSRALAVPTDISDPDAVRAAFAATAEAFGGLDVLVNNATLNYMHRMDEITDADLQAEVGVNILGAIYCMRDAIGLMRLRGGGDIVNISSETVTRPYPFLSLYAACKAAIENLTIGMREEVRAENIRITTLRSGPIESGGDFHQDADDDLMRRFKEATTAGGYLAAVGKRISPWVAANTLVSLITIPREAHIDQIAVRSI